MDAQGCGRPSLCQLYQWHYDNLGNLPYVYVHISNSPEYQLVTAGIQYDCQLINIEDYNGKGETQPNPRLICVCVCVVCVCV